jgi:hypothetical protein
LQGLEAIKEFKEALMFCKIAIFDEIATQVIGPKDSCKFLNSFQLTIK